MIEKNCTWQRSMTGLIRRSFTTFYLISDSMMDEFNGSSHLEELKSFMLQNVVENFFTLARNLSAPAAQEKQIN